MRALFDLVHPADALFFFHAMSGLQDRGHELRIASRHKDVLTPLLDHLGLAHEPISRAAVGRIGLAAELVTRDARLLRMARKFKPDVIVGFGAVSASHVGALMRRPSVGFYDTEHAELQLSLTLPFISEWHVPVTWNGPEARRTFRFGGSKQFAYLHPDRFVPDGDVAKSVGWDPAQDNFLIRTVAWEANHDHGRSGISIDQIDEIVRLLSARGRVHISAEGELPSRLEPLRFRGSPIAFHHLLAHCRLYCGESITVCSEAVALGVPALLQIDKEYGYVREQEDAGLICRFDSNSDMASLIDGWLKQPQEQFRGGAKHFASAAPDVNAYIIDAILSAGSRGATASQYSVKSAPAGSVVAGGER